MNRFGNIGKATEENDRKNMLAVIKVNESKIDLIEAEKVTEEMEVLTYIEPPSDAELAAYDHYNEDMGDR